MRAALLLTAALAATIPPAFAAPPPAPVRPRVAPRASSPSPSLGGAQALGTFDDWTAATHDESGQKTCYAFTIAIQSTPAVPGRDRVVLTVTERPSGRDAVALSAGFPYPAGVDAALIVDQASFPLYTAQRAAFARDGVSATARPAARPPDADALARSPGHARGRHVQPEGVQGRLRGRP